MGFEVLISYRMEGGPSSQPSGEVGRGLSLPEAWPQLQGAFFLRPSGGSRGRHPHLTGVPGMHPPCPQPLPLKVPRFASKEGIRVMGSELPGLPGSLQRTPSFSLWAPRLPGGFPSTLALQQGSKLQSRLLPFLSSP